MIAPDPHFDDSRRISTNPRFPDAVAWGRTSPSPFSDGDTLGLEAEVNDETNTSRLKWVSSPGPRKHASERDVTKQEMQPNGHAVYVSDCDDYK